ADLNGDLCHDLLVGAGDGTFLHFRNIGTWSSPGFVDLSSGMAFEYDNQRQTGVTVRSSVVVPTRHVMARTDMEIAGTYARLILDSDPMLADEIGFAIAHTPVQVLKDPDVFPEVFRENAVMIHEIDRYLDYVNLVERGGPNGSYTTTEYWINESGVRARYELPPEIYYWYIVHPKVTDEIPTYIDPDTGDPAPPPEGKFWRTYLLFHADASYPPDPSGDVHYPKDEPPPLLREKLQNVTTLWNGSWYLAPRGYDDSGRNNMRPWDFGDHAVERVSNWVEKSLPLRVAEDDDGSRPIQPVRIYHEHNGNCGELQDLTVAAARTALIPAQGVCDISEDHVWEEFYHEGWHHWDNWWSDGGSVVDWPGYYESHWKPYISCVWAHRGDDSIENMNFHGYTGTARIEVHLQDREGNPVDGGIVLASSHRMAEDANPAHTPFTPPPIPSFWNYTDEDGVAVLDLGKNNYTLNIWSPLGSVPDQQISVEEENDQVLTYQVDGLKRTWSPDEAPVGSHQGAGILDLTFEIIGGLQDAVNLLEGVRHDQRIAHGTLTCFVAGRDSFDTLRRGGGPDGFGTVYEPHVDVSRGHVTFRADEGVWYVVFMNTEVLRTGKVVVISIPTYVPAEDPVVTIAEPRDGQHFPAGADILIRGSATDNTGIATSTLSIDGRDIDITDRLIDGEWQYIWNTTGMEEGRHTISVTGADASGNRDTASIAVHIGKGGEEESTILLDWPHTMIVVVIFIAVAVAVLARRS
ncbi:MAG TPA: transglutaminase domain-containing protein, partial [Thermoplasmata archaeon]|nr:transglutaminase domain-containing protein [Thermoplasmata archaeon]